MVSFKYTFWINPQGLYIYPIYLALESFLLSHGQLGPLLSRIMHHVLRRKSVKAFLVLGHKVEVSIVSDARHFLALVNGGQYSFRPLFRPIL